MFSTLFVALPGFLFCYYYAKKREEEERHHPRPEFKPYSHLRIRTKVILPLTLPESRQNILPAGQLHNVLFAEICTQIACKVGIDNFGRCNFEVTCAVVCKLPSPQVDRSLLILSFIAYILEQMRLPVEGVLLCHSDFVKQVNHLFV